MIFSKIIKKYDKKCNKDFKCSKYRRSSISMKFILLELLLFLLINLKRIGDKIFFY